MSKRDPSNSGAESGVLDRALHLVRFLRAGCPWDAAQTPVSLTPYLLEESLELTDAILDEAEDAKLQSELGDLLLNIAFQIVLAEERGAFTAENVVRALEEKITSPDVNTTRPPCACTARFSSSKRGSRLCSYSRPFT